MIIVTNKPVGLTTFRYSDSIEIYQPTRRNIMKALSQFFAGVFTDSATSKGHNVQTEWDIARERASRFGPSHVAEIDAIFSRQS